MPYYKITRHCSAYVNETGYIKAASLEEARAHTENGGEWAWQHTEFDSLIENTEGEHIEEIDFEPHEYADVETNRILVREYTAVDIAHAVDQAIYEAIRAAHDAITDYPGLEADKDYWKGTLHKLTDILPIIKPGKEA